MAPKNETVLGYDSEEFFDEIKECSQFDHHQYNQSDHHCIGSNFTHRSHCCRQRSCSNCDSNHPFSDGFILDDNLNETYCDAGKSKIQCDKQRACHNCRSRMINKLVRKVENMEHAVLDTLHRAWNVCHFHHLPEWLQDNDYLLFGHRPPMASFEACFWSIFRLHTETLNIWTHAIGCFSFIVISIYLFLATSYASIPFVDKIMLGIFLITAIVCLALSTCYHTLACHSHQILLLVCKLDYCGISLLIAGSIVPCLYYAFYDSLITQIFYMLMTITLCAASVTVSFVDTFSDTKYRTFRASVFTIYAFSSIVPTIHWYLFHSNTELFYDSSFWTAIKFLSLMITLYVTGVLFYALRIPERFSPGKFDFYFHSHHLFHIFVLLAAICHLRGLTSLADVRLFSSIH
ncbi:Adiponectin receptor protein [Sarcoptes scabiei]|uniref:Adiponectin receptor protein n=1 Tax=Sarcoptes scabiei TaxID=52283 RepID=A0A834VA80_SARSC|nr:Adiponectin receptor protein [Sarcoptes scabiei]